MTVINLESALALHASGKIEEAESLYRKILITDNVNAVALEKLGIICLMTGRYQEATSLLSASIAVQPNNPDVYLNLAVAHKQQGDLPAAIECNEKAVALGCTYPEAFVNFGDTLLEAGRINEAIEKYKHAIRLRPSYAEARNSLASAYIRTNNLDDARKSLERALQLNPNYAFAHHNLGIVLHRNGKLAAAVSALDQACRLLPNPDSFTNLGNALFDLGLANGEAICLQQSEQAYLSALRYAPQGAEIYSNLGLLYTQQLQFDKAINAFEHAVQINEHSFATHFNFGVVLLKLERMDEAISNLQKAVDIYCAISGCASSGVDATARQPEPTIKELAYSLIDLLRLPVIYADVQSIQLARFHYKTNLAKARAIAELNGAELGRHLDLLRRILFLLTNFYLPYQCHNDRDLQKSYAALASKLLESELEPFLQNRSIERKKGPIRLGVASENLRYHHGAYWALGWLANLPSSDYEIYVYSLNGKTDAVTGKFAALGTFRWLPFRESNYLSSLEQIKNDQLDVLLIPDVGISPANRILSLTRLAAVQCVGWGHPETTGSPNIDYFLSSDLMEPPRGQEHYSETLVRMPNVSWHYEYPDDSDVVGELAEFGIPSGKTVYGAIQSLFKYLPQYDYVFPAIAKQNPKAHFVFISNEAPIITQTFDSRLRQCFESSNLNYDEHVQILPRLTPTKFMKLLSVLDINLDSIGWTGGFITMRSLAMNCPVVTTPGEFMRGRHSYGMLTMIGVEELIADSVDEYIVLAANLGLDTAMRETIKGKIASNKQKLFHDTECVNFLDSFLKSKVHN